MKWLLVAIIFLTGCHKNPPARLSMEAYVWQSQERPEVTRAIQTVKSEFDALHIRAAELQWTGSQFEIDRTLTALPATNCGLVVRIGASAGSLEWNEVQTTAVAKIFRDLGRLHPREIQCDYDCPQKRLAIYSKLLADLQAAAGEVPVMPTVLPSWLAEPEFLKLIDPRVGYVLQLHSLQLPSDPAQPVVIFDPVAARKAVAIAASLNKSFRVAMATYGCEVRFRPDGKIADVISEDAATYSSAGIKRSFALADPVASAALVQEWMTKRPSGLTGVIWYRLPIEGDHRNWPLQTLRKVMAGENADPKVEVVSVLNGGATDLFLRNNAQFPARLPSIIRSATKPVAADGTTAYRNQAKPDGVEFALQADVWPWIDPGRKIPIGWVRSAKEQPRIEWKIIP